MTDPEQDEVFDAYLKRRSVLPALDNSPEPPVALDQKVLAQAREAIGPRSVTASGGATGREAAPPTGGGDSTSSEPAKLPLRRAPRWAVPIALAATILLCLSVVININLNTNRPSPNLERATAARADLEASAEANAIAESSAAADAARASAPVAPGAAPSAVPAPALASAAAANGEERRESFSGSIPSREVLLPEAKVAGVQPRHAPVEAESAEPAESLAQANVAAPSARGQSTAARSTADGTTVGEGTAVAESALTADTSVARARAAKSASAADKAVLFAREVGVARPAAAPSTAHPVDPKVWLQQITALRAAGKTAEADAEMRRFTAAFPAYVTEPAPPAQGDPPK